MADLADRFEQTVSAAVGMPATASQLTANAKGAATQEIVHAVTQASAGTTEVTHSITGVARMAKETGAGASDVLSAFSELARQAEHLRHQMYLFLDQVEAA